MMNITKSEAKVIIEALWNYINSMNETMREYPQFADSNSKSISEAKLIAKRLERELND